MKCLGCSHHLVLLVFAVDQSKVWEKKKKRKRKKKKSIPPRNVQTNDCNSSFAGNVSLVQCDGAPASASNEVPLPPMRYILEETPMSPGLNFFESEDHHQGCRCRRKRSRAPDEASSSTHPASHGSDDEEVDHNCGGICQHIPAAAAAAQSNSFPGSNISGPGLTSTADHPHAQVYSRNIRMRRGENRYFDLLPSAGYLFTQTPSTYQLRQYPPRNWMGYSATGDQNGTGTFLSEANGQQVPSDQPQQITFAADQNYANSSLEDPQYTGSDNTASSSTDTARQSLHQPTAPLAILSEEGNVDNAAAVASRPIARPMTFGDNVSLRELMASDLWEGIHFESFVQELMRTIDCLHDEPEAAFWRSRIVVAVHGAVEGMDEGASGDASLIVDILSNLMQNIVETQRTAPNEQMRLDVVNMTYEELRELQRSTGSVKTGLSQEIIQACMNKYEYKTKGTTSSDDLDRCCICQDDCMDGQGVGRLNCGHEFHFDCIKEWLLQKNSCPLCKRTGLTI